MRLKPSESFTKPSFIFHAYHGPSVCVTDTATGIISLPLMSVIYFDSVASLAWVGRNQLNKHILSWKASWLSTTWRECYRIVAMVRKIPPKPTSIASERLRVMRQPGSVWQRGTAAPSAAVPRAAQFIKFNPIDPINSIQSQPRIRNTA